MGFKLERRQQEAMAREGHSPKCHNEIAQLMVVALGRGTVAI